MKKAFLAVFALGLGYLTLWPVPLTPEVYEPLRAPAFTGDFESNDAMAALELVLLPDAAVGPEDLAVMPDGTVYTTDLAGKLYRIDGEVPELIEDLGGRPLGLKAGPDGALYIADSYRGILRWTGPGRLEPWCQKWRARRLSMRTNSTLRVTARSISQIQRTVLTLNSWAVPSRPQS